MRRLIEEPIAIRTPVGSLEGVFGYEARAAAGQGVLLLSPHPRIGGDLENNVIAGAATVLTEWGFSVLRFNYRGVGRSEGGPDDPLESLRYWSTFSERDNADALADAIAALDWLTSTCGEVHAFGYSYGALVALRLAAARSEIRSVAVVGLDLAHHDVGFLPEVSAPVLAIHGQRDYATPLERVDSALAALPSSSRREILARSDHFFIGQERQVAAIARDFFEDPPEPIERAAAHRRRPRENTPRGSRAGPVRTWWGR